MLATEEVQRILQVTTNFKHKAMLLTIYGSGLRVSEAANLKISDIDSQRMQIRVENGKGDKSRMVILSEKCLKLLRDYCRVYRPKSFLFPGAKPETPISVRAIQVVFKQSLKKANIQKAATVHTLRHCFATHLLENGIDIRIVQEYLGHSSLQTTNVYLHVTNKMIMKVQSPADMLSYVDN